MHYRLTNQSFKQRKSAGRPGLHINVFILYCLIPRSRPTYEKLSLVTLIDFCIPTKKCDKGFKKYEEIPCYFSHFMSVFKIKQELSNLLCVSSLLAIMLDKVW